ncbi:zinc-binding dehydrogenase [Arthrobacter sp. I2-34]|uniref:Zinc-binding dehydrogenase n=1 Tax=Arthrobacter hankyongi TaxID=2904801 RepID=A0ABS9L407_9MICC|nr:zinc-binding dehydrogenase [Arthrobacter hankyongi]MCG2621224.1 zinc-binding dehydrogenase [Arthrobacter hankyongi]
MTLKNRSAVFTAPGRPVEFHESSLPAPPGGGMIVKVGLAGICGTDAHRLGGDLPAPAAPITFGHEGVGTVEELGAGTVRDWAGVELSVGDSVYWFPPSGCGRCYHCSVQLDPAICANATWPPEAGKPNAAAFQDYATLDSKVGVYRIPEGTPLEAVIAFGCAMPTALGGNMRAGMIEPGQTVVVQGAGPVGLASTMLAGLSQARQVITIGGPDNRLKAAETLGATTTLSIETTTPEERRETILELTGGHGADVVFEAAGHLSAFAEAIPLLNHNGRYVVQGLYSGSGTVPVDPHLLNNRSLSIIGSLGFKPNSIQRTVELAARYHDRFGLADLVTGKYPLTELERAIDSMRAGDTIKNVIDPSM